MTSCLISSRKFELPVERPEKEFLEEPSRGVGGCNSIMLSAEGAVGFSVTVVLAESGFLALK